MFDWNNYSYDPWTSGFIPPAGETNPKFGEASSAYNPRRLQVGVRYQF